MTAAAVVNVARANLLTANQRMHWAQKSRRTRNLRELAAWSAHHEANAPSYEKRVRIVVGVAYPDARRRDVHNLMPTVKACIDGLVDAGWLTDDSDKYLQGPDLRPSAERCDKGLACRLTFTFEEPTDA